jgi:hypothetical protein
MFNPQAYGPEVARIFSATSDTRRLIETSDLPPLVRTGLYLRFGFWQEAHETAQDINTTEGSYWHAIVHRQEPDPGNAAYWFRRVGNHPIFPELRRRAAELGYNPGPRWDPIAFIQFCESNPTAARPIEQAEWELLFDHCARP